MAGVQGSALAAVVSNVGGLGFTPFAFTRDNRFLISGSAETTIKIYDLKTSKDARTFSAIAKNNKLTGPD